MVEVSAHEISEWPKSTRLTRLYLPKCSLWTVGIVEKLQSFPALTVLEIVWSSTHLDRLDFLKIGDAIARYNPCLQSLTLDVSMCWQVEPDQEEETWHSDILHSCLQGMKFLTKLSVSDEAIWKPQLIAEHGGDQSFDHGLSHSLPHQLECLELISQWKPLAPGSDTAAYEHWQGYDLCQLLEDKSYTQLKRIVTRTAHERKFGISYLDRHGWTHEFSLGQHHEQIQTLHRMAAS